MRDNELIRRLSQLRDMRREVDELSQRIAKIEIAQQGRVTAPGHNRGRAGLEDARARMDARRMDCMVELGRLYAFIDGIPESRLRRIFSFRYIDGMTWLQIAFKIGECDEQYPRKVHDRWLRKMAKKGVGLEKEAPDPAQRSAG